MVRGCAVLALVAAAASSGCAKRQTAYRFRAPLVAGVSAPEIPEPRRAVFRSTSQRPFTASRPTVERLSPPPEVSNPVANLYAFVGEHDDDAGALDLVFRALDRLDIALADEVRAATDGPGLVRVARERGALSTRAPALGDLVVFDGLQGTGPASLVGVVTRARDDGTVEFIYRGLGVVRRGYLNRDRPTTQRDRDGRVLNTWLRVKKGRYRKGLAGDFFATYIRLDRLTR